MASNINSEECKDKQGVYLAKDIQEILGISKSSAYRFLESVYNQADPPFRVVRVGKVLRVTKSSFDAWLIGT